MSLSAGSLASLCNSRLSRERHPSTLLSSLNLPMDNYLRPSSRLCVPPSLLRSFVAAFSFLFSRDPRSFATRVALSSVRLHHDEIVALVNLIDCNRPSLVIHRSDHSFEIFETFRRNAGIHS